MGGQSSCICIEIGCKNGLLRGSSEPSFKRLQQGSQTLISTPFYSSRWSSEWSSGLSSVILKSDKIAVPDPSFSLFFTRLPKIIIWTIFLIRADFALFCRFFKKWTKWQFLAVGQKKWIFVHNLDGNLWRKHKKPGWCPNTSFWAHFEEICKISQKHHQEAAPGSHRSQIPSRRPNPLAGGLQQGGHQEQAPHVRPGALLINLCIFYKYAVSRSNKREGRSPELLFNSYAQPYFGSFSYRD